MANQKHTDIQDPIARTILSYVSEADTARQERMLQNQENYNAYHLKGDWSHKRQGQSKEFLAKTQSAVEQLASFLQQGLIDQGKWFDIENEPGIVNPLILPEEMCKLLGRQLHKTKFPLVFSDALKTGLLASLMVAKVGGKMHTVSDFYAEKSRNWYGKSTMKLKRRDRQVWQLDISLIRPEDYFPDPHANNLYKVQRIEIDYYELIEMAEAHNEKCPGEFNMETIKNLAPGGGDLLEQAKRARETGQNAPSGMTRPRVVLYECWGNLIDISSGALMERNCVTVITDDGQTIRAPSENPWWNGEDPFVESAIVRVPFSVWHRALMDAAVKHNLAANELYNLMLDAGLMAVWGIKQMREDWVDDPSKYADGIPAGETVMVNGQCPPGMKAVERVDTGVMQDQSALNMFNVIDREFQQSSMTSDIRMGTLPQRAVKATEVVASSQAITGVFNGVVKNIEEAFVKEILRKSWNAIAQNANDLNLADTKALLGVERAMKIAALTPEERFAGTVNGNVFKVFGLSMAVNKINDFRKISTLLQTIGTSNTLIQEFQQKYSFTKLLGEIVKSLDINEDKIKLDPQEKERIEKQRAQMMALLQQQANGGKKGGGNAANVEQGADVMSQMPSFADMSAEAGAQAPTSEMADTTQATGGY
jgi:hypothetical protein